MNYILNKKLKYYTKEILKYFNITILAFGFIITIVLIKYKPMYQVSISGENLGYVEDKNVLEESIKENILKKSQKNVDTINIRIDPEYELKFVDKTIETKENQIAQIVENNTDITYKYYEIALNNEPLDLVNTLDEATNVITQIKTENQTQNLDLSIIEKYTENAEEAKTTSIDIAKNDIQTKINQKVEEQEMQKKEQERINKMPEINGIKLAYVPVSGTISSRYGVRSRLRKSTHTGLDIASPKGTPIKVVASGTVTCASNKGAYGNLVKVNHGNNLETWYAHTSKMYVSVGQKVNAGEVIAAVGSTGNSTGNHLHLEIRINGTHVNPQNYLYK